MRLVLADDLAPELAAALAPVATLLGDGDLTRIRPEATAFVGVPDPLALAGAPGPVVAVPVQGSSRRSDGALLRHAAVVALLDPGDLPADTGGWPVVLAGLPAPPPAGPGPVVDVGPRGGAIARALREQTGDLATGERPHGVTLVAGGGAALAARAASAWRAGRATVALPGTRASALLSRARCARAPSTLAAVELTHLLLRAPALARAMAARGRHAAAELPAPLAVATALLEAAELACTAPGGREGALGFPRRRGGTTTRTGAPGDR